MSKDKTIIKRETWFRVFSSKLYEEFLNEWLTLHQTYFETNPLPPKKLLGELSFIVVKGLIELYSRYIKDDELIKQFKNDLKEYLKEGVING